MSESPMPSNRPEVWIPDVRAKLYLWFSGVFVTCLILANVLGVKLFRFDLNLPLLGHIKVEHTTGMLTFPVTFVLTDLLNEYYGKKGARRVIYLAFAMGALAFVFIWISRQFPILEGIPGTADQKSYELIFGAAALMYIASLIAFFFGSLLDIFLFAVFKRATRGRMIWLRATGSTVISQLFDSFIVTFVFFWAIPLILNQDKATVGFVFATALTGYILKFFIAVGLTPFIYLGRWVIRTQLGIQPLPAR